MRATTLLSKILQLNMTRILDVDFDAESLVPRHREIDRLSEIVHGSLFLVF